MDSSFSPLHLESSSPIPICPDFGYLFQPEPFTVKPYAMRLREDATRYENNELQCVALDQ